MMTATTMHLCGLYKWKSTAKRHHHFHPQSDHYLSKHKAFPFRTEQTIAVNNNGDSSSENNIITFTCWIYESEMNEKIYVGRSLFSFSFLLRSLGAPYFAMKTHSTAVVQQHIHSDTLKIVSVWTTFTFMGWQTIYVCLYICWKFQPFLFFFKRVAIVLLKTLENYSTPLTI